MLQKSRIKKKTMKIAFNSHRCPKISPFKLATFLCSQWSCIQWTIRDVGVMSIILANDLTVLFAIVSTLAKRKRIESKLNLKKHLRHFYSLFWFVFYLTPVTGSPFRATLLCTIGYVHRFLFNTIPIINHLVWRFTNTSNGSNAVASIASGRTWWPTTRSPNESKAVSKIV